MRFIQPVLLVLLLVAIGSCADHSTEQSESHVSSEIRAFANGGYVASQGDSIYVRVIGDGAPILFIHGGPGLDHTYLLPHMGELAKDHQLIFYDQRAGGKSSINVDSSTISRSGFLLDIENIRISLGLDHWVVLGHSWGGLLAMQYATVHQDHVNALILVNSTPASTELQQIAQQKSIDSETEDELEARMAIIRSEAFKNDDPQAYEELYRLLFESEFYDRKYLDSLDLNFQPSFAETGRKLRHLTRDYSEYDVHMDLEELEIPVLIIYGAIDPLTEISSSDLENFIPESKLVIIPESGHFPFIESKGFFFNEVRSFISATPEL